MRDSGFSHQPITSGRKRADPKPDSKSNPKPGIYPNARTSGTQANPNSRSHANPNSHADPDACTKVLELSDLYAARPRIFLLLRRMAGEQCRDGGRERQGGSVRGVIHPGEQDGDDRNGLLATGVERDSLPGFCASDRDGYVSDGGRSDLQSIRDG